MTTVEGLRRRSLTYTMFEDIADAPIIGWTSDSVTFDGNLTPEQVHLIWARMESKDDADQAKRAQLRADCSALPEDDPQRRIYGYLLGE